VTLPLVLVHGGAHGAWCWEPTLPLLDPPVLAVDLPPKSIRGVPAAPEPPPDLMTTTLDDFARSALADVDAAGFERFVLAGHSMGGLTIAELARRVPERVAHLVFVSCMVPPEGGLVVEGVPGDSREAASASFSDEGEVEERSVAGLEEDGTRRMFCNDMDDAQTRFVLDHVGSEAFAVFGERVTRHGIPRDLPVTYVRLARDQALTPADQSEAIARLRESPGSEVCEVELDAGHDVMISRPDLLAGALRDVRAQVAASPTAT